MPNVCHKCHLQALKQPIVDGPPTHVDGQSDSSLREGLFVLCSKRQKNKTKMAIRILASPNRLEPLLRLRPHVLDYADLPWTNCTRQKEAMAKPKRFDPFFPHWISLCSFLEQILSNTFSLLQNTSGPEWMTRPARVVASLWPSLKKVSLSLSLRNKEVGKKTNRLVDF